MGSHNVILPGICSLHGAAMAKTISIEDDANHLTILLGVFGGLAVLAGVTGLLAPVVGDADITQAIHSVMAEPRDSLIWIASGLLVCAIAGVAWRYRRRIVISDVGVTYIPTIRCSVPGFVWADVQHWVWRTIQYGSPPEIGISHELQLTMLDGSELLIPQPYCHDSLRKQLAHRIVGQEVVVPPS